MNITDQDKVEAVTRMVRDACEEHGLVAAVFLCAPTHATHALLLDLAPWSRIAIVEDAEGAFQGLRIRSKLDEYKARGMTETEALAAQRADMEATINTLDHIGVQAGQTAMLALEAARMLTQKFGAETQSVRVGEAWGKKPS